MLELPFWEDSRRTLILKGFELEKTIVGERRSLLLLLCLGE